jgi:hypothetical protein
MPNATVEGVNNTGSDFQIYRAANSGVLIDAPFTINRSNGYTYVNGLFSNNYIWATNFFPSYGNAISFNANVAIGGDLWANNVHVPGSINMNGTMSCANASMGGEIDVLGDIRYMRYAPSNNLMGFFWNGAGACVAVDYGGYVAQLAVVSDERLKQDITTSTYDCLALVKTLPLYTFTWMDHSNAGNPQPADASAVPVPVGFVAQSLYDVAPYLVIKGDTSSPPWDGNNPVQLWQIEANNMLATLVGAVQQLATKVGALEAKIATLEARQPPP